jgi:hypothetical protein
VPVEQHDLDKECTLQATHPCWYFILKMKIAAQGAALVDSASGRKALAEKNDHY